MGRSSAFRVLPTFLLFCIFHLLVSATGVRKEWRSLSSNEKSDYIKAVKCLQSKPSILKRNYPASVTLFDDVAIIHILKTPNIHFNGQFLPWHRYFTLLHELALRRECGYKGYQPYWDWSLDLPPKGNWLDSPLFDPVTGFGGNGKFVEIPQDFVYYGFDMTPLSLTGEGPVTEARGNDLVLSILPVLTEVRTGGGCVPNGPFKDLKIRMGPFNSTEGNERCLNRDFAPSFVEGLGLPGLLDTVTAAGSYMELLSVIEFVHGIGHVGVGGLIGEMFNLYSSPTDPLFFLHHANLDRIWWNWQKGDLTNRLKDVSGFAFTTGDETVSLDFKLDLGVMGTSRPIRDFMDPRRLGYDYST